MTTPAASLAAAADAVRALIAEADAVVANLPVDVGEYQLGYAIGGARRLQQALTAILNAGVER